MSLALRKIELSIWGCTDGEKVSRCNGCKLDKWECVIFKEDSKYEYLYTVAGNF